ncbi:MAG: hypothetical protein ACTSQI_10965 [Candidatus Helarchaeota archaeon]
MTVIDEDKFHKNANLLREQWEQELDYRMKEVKQLVRDDFYSGIWGILFNHFIAVIYSFFLSKDIREMILEQGEILLEASKEYDGNDEKIIAKYFEPYLKADPSWERTKKRHRKLPELKERYKRSFIMLLNETHLLLNSEGNDYNELFKNAYRTREKAWAATFSIIDTAEEDLEFAIRHKMIKINRLLQEPIYRILRKEIAIGKESYHSRIHSIFDSY